MTITDSGIEANKDDVADLVGGFESGRLSPDEFNHRAHLTVALRYALLDTEGEALDMMRRALLAFLDRHKLVGVYHETMTVFWMKRVCAFAARADGGKPLAELARELARECADPCIVYGYYSEALIKSDAARAAYVEPDLRPLDF